MKRLALILPLAAASVCAQPALAPPHIGFVQDAAGTLRPVEGVAGGFVLGRPAARGVVSAAFSNSLGLLTTRSSLAAMNREGRVLGVTDAPPGQALFAFSPDGAAGLVYFAGLKALVRWNGAKFARVPFDGALLAGNPVLSIALPDSWIAEMIVKRDDGLWSLSVLLETGRVEAQTALAGVTAPVLMLANGDLLYSRRGGVVLRRANGAEVSLPARLPERFAFQSMGQDWVQILDPANGVRSVIRVTPHQEALYLLPEVNQ
jgi:hypothetical protein